MAIGKDLNGQDAFFLVEEMDKRVYIDVEGQVYIRSASAGSDVVPKLVSQIYSKFKDCTLDIRVGATDAVSSMPVYVFIVPMASSHRVFVGLWSRRALASYLNWTMRSGDQYTARHVAATWTCCRFYWRAADISS